ncbi:hypothetical protein [Streptococcus cristatus]|uniref:hypothetical protein n=1 Tax=Streptococcus cristatus TaxID=45634 RepID=UPI000F6843E3|nr:hypothetical protein [Streptococcus cristatus]RSJ72456.1 hypothetical protein D8797_08250 [Streptococcus cristatus]
MKISKKIFHFLLICIVLLPSLLACSSANNQNQENSKTKYTNTRINNVEEVDKSNLSYLVSESLENSKYPVLVEDIAIQTMSQEYYEELEFNSQENIYFGHNESQLLQMFDTAKYSFTVNSNGKTIVGLDSDLFKEDYLTKAMKNVVIGSGVIIVCASVSVVLSGGATTPMAIMIVAGQLTTEAALASAISGVVTAGISKFNGESNEEILENTIISASEGFKYAAIFSGATKVLTSTGRYISTNVYPKSNSFLTQKQAIKEGGTYRELFSKFKGNLKDNKLQIHHVPANASSSETVMSRLDGPSILMTEKDHALTASYGNSLSAQSYRAKQAKYIEEGNWKKAFEMDVNDIRSKFGEKYDEALKAAERAAREKKLW